MLLKLIFFSFIYSSFVFSSPITLKVGVYENKPKVFIDSDGTPSGFFIDLLNEIAKSEQWKIEYIPCEWNDCLQKLESNEIDIMPDMAHSKEREDRFDFGDEVVLSSWSEIYTTNQNNIVSILDLDKKKIAVLNNSIQYHELLTSTHAFDIRPIFVGVKSFDEAFVLLNSAQVDAAAVNVFYVIHKKNTQNIKHTFQSSDAQIWILKKSIDRNQKEN